jgi:RNA polymerase sigma factor (sigma-70 family)
METGITTTNEWCFDGENDASEPKVVRCRPSKVQRPSTFDEGYLVRLRSGDEETAKHFNSYFRRMLKIKIWAKYGRASQEDLIDEVMAAALEKILKGEPRDPACLAGYVRSICANIVAKPRPANSGVEVDLDRISDKSLSVEDKLLADERARTVRAVLAVLKVRDRNILTDLFYNDLERDEVCLKYSVTREQLRLVLFRARGRFQERWKRR